MMTGDRRPVAERIGAELGFRPDEIHADLLPADKVDLVAALAAKGRVAYVGDGVNDAAARRAPMSALPWGRRAVRWPCKLPMWRSLPKTWAAWPPRIGCRAALPASSGRKPDLCHVGDGCVGGWCAGL